MTSPTLLSPNTGNYRVGKGIVEFSLDGIVWRHMGNCSSFESTPEIEKLDHFSSMEGVKSKDASIVLSQGGTLKLVLDEWTPANIGMAFLGTVDEAAVGGPTIDVFQADAVAGHVRFTSRNTRGPKVNIHYYNVSFIPSAAYDMVSEEWGTLELSGEILVSQDDATSGKFGLAQVTNIDS